MQFKDRVFEAAGGAQPGESIVCIADCLIEIPTDNNQFSICLALLDKGNQVFCMMMANAVWVMSLCLF